MSLPKSMHTTLHTIYTFMDLLLPYSIGFVLLLIVLEMLLPGFVTLTVSLDFFVVLSVVYVGAYRFLRWLVVDRDATRSE